MAKEDYLRAFILRGKNRGAIINELSKGEKTQAQLHQITKMYRTHARRVLLELQKKGLVKCLNPDDRIYKLYVLTNLGLKIKKEIEKIR